MIDNHHLDFPPFFMSLKSEVFLDFHYNAKFVIFEEFSFEGKFKVFIILRKTNVMEYFIYKFLVRHYFYPYLKLNNI